jgi:hypothetical protein
MTGITSDRSINDRVKKLPYGLVRCADGLVRTEFGYGRVVPEWRVDRSVPVPEPDQATRIASWFGWRVAELAGVAVPAGVAVAVTPWAWLVSGGVAAWWAVQGFRAAAEQRPLRAELAARRTAADDTPSGSEVDPVVSPVDVTLDGPAPDADPTWEGAA